MRRIRPAVFLAVVAIELILLGARAATAASDDSRTDGTTLCIPLVGPIQRLSPTLPDSVRRIVAVHESVHAAQCRRMGALANFAARVRSRGRLLIEGEAYCAQIRYEVGRGADTGMAFARTVDELIETVPPRAFGNLPDDTVRARFAALCPDMTAGVREP